MLRDLLRVPNGFGHRAAATLVAAFPPYQVAFWPDGWDLEPDGSVLVRDTHMMAEARRWYSLADRNRSREDGRRVMSILGIFVPRAIVDLAGRCFPSGQVASVAVQLIAGEWIADRRRRLLEKPLQTLAERTLSWRGSRYDAEMGPEHVRSLIQKLIRASVDERLIPDAGYRIRVHREHGYGIACHRCVLDVCLDRYSADRVLEVLAAALVPWNRAVARDGAAALLIKLEAGASRPALKL